MDLDLVQMLSEPGQRQLVVAGGGAVLGFAKDLWDRYQIARMDQPEYKIRVCQGSQSVIDDARRTGTISRLLRGGSVLFPAAVGLEEAVRTETPVADSYVLESGFDFASSFVGFYFGKVAVPWLIEGVVGKIWNAYNSLKK